MYARLLNAAICGMVLLFAASPAFGRIYSYYPVTENTSSDWRADISGDHVVWLGTNSEGFGVLLKNIHDPGEPLNITAGNGIAKDSADFIDYPNIDNGIVVFRFHESTDNTDRIYLYNVSSGQLTLLTEYAPGSFGGGAAYPPSYSSLRPMVHDGKIVWAQWDGNDYEVMLYDGNAIRQITDNTFNDYEPQIHNGLISWTGSTPDTDKEDVYFYDGATVTDISPDFIYKSEDSFLQNGNIAFCSRTKIVDQINDFDIYLWDGGLNRNISNTYGNDYEADISENNLVAWTNYGRTQGTSDTHVFAWDGYKKYDVFENYQAPAPRYVINQASYGSKVLAQVFDGIDSELVIADYIQGVFRPEDFVTDIGLIDNYAYAAGQSGTLRAIDTTQAAGLVEVGTTPLGSAPIYDMEIQGDLLYLARTEGGVSVLDITDRAAPSPVASWPTAMALQLAVDSGTIYVADGSAGIKQYDISDLPLVRQVAAIPTASPTVSLQVDDFFVVTAERTGGMQIRDKNTLAHVGSFAFAGMDVVQVLLDGQTAYLLCLDSGVRIVDISDPSLPVLIGELPLPGITESAKYEITKLYSHLFISTGTEGLFVVDVYDKLSPVITEHIDTLGIAGGHKIANGRIVLADGPEGMKIIAVSDYNSPAVAFIAPLSPVPDKIYETESFLLNGSGQSPAGTITGYQWKSSLDGVFSNAATADLLPLRYGMHDISLKVQNSDGSWSQEKNIQLFLSPGVRISSENVTFAETEPGVWQAGVNIQGDFEYRIQFERLSDEQWFGSSAYSSSPIALLPPEIEGDYLARLHVRNVNSISWYEVQIKEYSSTIAQPLVSSGTPALPLSSALPQYYIWQDEFDGAWHIRWLVNDLQQHSFTGQITADTRITDVQGVKTEVNDVIALSPDESTLTFSGVAQDGMDGIDFYAEGNAVLTVALSVDGIDDPATVFIGGGLNSPGELPFRMASLPHVFSDVFGVPPYVAAQDLGFYIWQDIDDAQWHVRWSGDSLSDHNFRGTLKTDTAFVNVLPYKFEFNDVLNAGQQVLTFEGYANNGEDGFDFEALPGSRIAFSLYIDNLPAVVSLGENQNSPGSSDFVLLSNAIPVTSSLLGRPTYTAAVDLGYYLWQDEVGGWHIRWSGDSLQRRNFTGIIASSLGFNSVASYSVEPDDKIELNGSFIRFNGYADNGEDGLDFFVPAGARLTCALQINGESSLLNTVLGPHNENPVHHPFVISTLGTVEGISPFGAPLYTPALDLGYFLWQDAGTQEWHLRWSGDSLALHSFDGAISASLPFSAVVPVKFETNDTLEIQPSVVTFHGKASNGEDGLDFSVQPGTLISLSLTVDGVEDSAFIFVGQDGGNPSASSFVLPSN